VASADRGAAARVRVGQREQTGSAAPRGSNITMLGGTEIEETRSVKISEEPKWLKYLLLPFAVIAAPVKYGADVVAGDPAGAPRCRATTRRPAPSCSPAPTVTDYETAQLEGIDRELASAPSGATPAPSRRLARDRTAPTGLELLRRARRAAPPRDSRAGARVARPPRPHGTRRRARSRRRRSHGPRRPAVAGQVDRDGDGRTDSLDHARERRDRARVVRRELRRQGPIARCLRHRVARGRADRGGHELRRPRRHVDRAARRPGDGAPRRQNGDGQIDSWSIFRGGVITRLERDANGDGFRDRVALLQDGHLAREERDDDGDGRTDLITYFDANEHVARVEEDSNDDGQMDVVSYYEDGKLARREVLDASVLGPAPAATRSASSAAHARPGVRVPVRTLARALARRRSRARGETGARAYADLEASLHRGVNDARAQQQPDPARARADSTRSRSRTARTWSTATTAHESPEGTTR
jgi:hypothetical protein